MTTDTLERDRVEAFVTPRLLTWARQRANLTIETAAKRLGVVPATLESWESGDVRPTLRKATVIAQKFHVPFGYLFLSKPPELDISIPDLRTMSGGHPSEISTEFYDVLCDAFRKQDWYRNHLREQGTEPLPFVGRFSRSSSILEVASNINETMELSSALRNKSPNWEEFLRGFISKAEDIGIIVLRNSVVGNNTTRHLNREEFRGFVISDSIAPLIFLNGDDWKSARIFTLAHELAHIWIDESGISNPMYRRTSDEQAHPVERICDKIATEALVPQAEFLSAWDNTNSKIRNLTFLTRRFKVSRLVILRRALELERISRQEFWEEYDEIYHNNNVTEDSASQGGGDFYRNMLIRNSHTFANTVANAVLAGQILDRDAAHLLNIQVPTLNRFIQIATGEA